jgi:hypothetical protein
MLRGCVALISEALFSVAPTSVRARNKTPGTSDSFFLIPFFDGSIMDAKLICCGGSECR